MVQRDKEDHYIMIKGKIHQGNIIFVNIYGPNIRAPKYINQKLTELKAEMNSNTIIIEDVNTTLSTIGRSSSRESVRKR